MDFKAILRDKLAELERESGNSPSEITLETPENAAFPPREDLNFPSEFQNVFRFRSRKSPYPRVKRLPPKPAATKPARSFAVADLSLAEVLALGELFTLAAVPVPTEQVTERDIAKAYHKAIKAWHPDINSDPRANENCLRANEYYNIVKGALATPKKAA